MEEFNKLRILPRDNLSKHDYIKQYFYQNEMTRKLYEVKNFRMISSYIFSITTH